MSLYRISLLALISILALAVGSSASGPNLVVNPGFEDPLGSEWVVEYVSPTTGGSFSFKERTLWSDHTGSYGAQLQVPSSVNGKAHAYFKQVVTGLNPNASYTVSAWTRHVWDRTDKYHVYFEALGGGAPQYSPISTTVYAQYAVLQTPDPNGQIEIRLHMDKYQTTSSKTCDAHFDDVCLELVPEPSSLAALLSGGVVLAAALRRRT